jgi:hypothetical protein
MLQQTQTIPRPGHALHQTRRLLPGRTHHRRHHRVASMTFRTRPRPFQEGRKQGGSGNTSRISADLNWRTPAGRPGTIASSFGSLQRA